MSRLEEKIAAARANIGADHGLSPEDAAAEARGTAVVSPLLTEATGPAGWDDDGPALPDLPDGASVTLQTAMVRIMADMRAVGKEDRFGDEPGSRVKYNYRGVERIVQRVKPLLVRHQVTMVPSRICSLEGRDVERASGGRSHEATVVMEYLLTGPTGDTRTVQAAGMALDTSDKSVPKAQAVAWRTALIQTFNIPTQDEDPDASRLERGDAPAPSPLAYVEEIADPYTTMRRLYQIKTELANHRLTQRVITNEVGDEEELGAMLARIGNARRKDKE